MGSQNIKWESEIWKRLTHGHTGIEREITNETEKPNRTEKEETESFIQKGSRTGFFAFFLTCLSLISNEEMTSEPVHTYNLTYLEGRNMEYCGLRPVWKKKITGLHLNQ
jgi:hypothetical protein